MGEGALEGENHTALDNLELVGDESGAFGSEGIVVGVGVGGGAVGGNGSHIAEVCLRTGFSKNPELRDASHILDFPIKPDTCTLIGYVEHIQDGGLCEEGGVRQTK